MDKERIKKEAEAFFEWPTQDKTHVTTTSMLIFANVIAEIAMNEERETCAAECDRLTWAIDHGGNKYRRPAGADVCATAIRKRSNNEVSEVEHD